MEIKSFKSLFIIALLIFHIISWSPYSLMKMKNLIIHHHFQKELIFFIEFIF